MTVTKTYEFIKVDENAVNLSAYNKLENLTANIENWKKFGELSAEETRDILLNIVNELMMPYVSKN